MGLYVVHARNETLAAATVETLLQVVAPATKRLRVVAWGISLAGVTASEVPGDIELLRQTTAGTASAFTPVKLDEADPAAIATAQVTFTAEPTAGDILHPIQLTPNGGTWEVSYAPDERPVVAASGRIGIRANFAAVQTNGGTAWLKFEE